MSHQPLKIVILGGGTSGWMAASLFANKWLGKNGLTHAINITLVESPDVSIVGVGEGSTPTLKRFFQILNVPESDWMPRCNATYKLNVRFDGWSPKSGINSYSHPFTSQVDTFTSRAFFINSRTRCLGLDTHTQPEDFILNGVLAKQGKGPLTPDNFPFQMEYGYHFDSHLLGKFLTELATSMGVKHISEHVVGVERKANGDIANIKTKSGKTIKGDFFVDCSGFAALLMKKTLGVKFHSYKENLFNDSALVIPSPISEKIPVETVSTALSAGWCWQIPLRNRFGNGYVYSSDFINADSAETELRAHLNCLDSDQEARHLKMKVGRLESQWSHNCIGLGLSQGFIEPLEATALHLVQICIEMFIERFEEGNFTDKYKDKYNNEVGLRFEHVRDYIVAHYKLNTRDDSDYWRANRDNNHLSNSLSQLLTTWYKRDDLTKEIDRQRIGIHFNSMSWHCLLSGYGAFPPLADNQPGTGDLYQEQSIQQFLQGCALNFSSHSNNLNN
ncbi:MAG: hypothetical protein ACI9LM_001010 [Alteromonadaceae bacterium]|jgi:hypothetical protein